MTAHNSLYFAYKKALLLAAQEPSIKAIAFTCLYLRKSKFPRDLGAHVALRTIRRFLEHDIGKKFERVILAVPSEDFELYKLLIKGALQVLFRDMIITL
jgi:O-acetyl-ADP-ribose deacetylase (regulator of RNase III)